MVIEQSLMKSMKTEGGLSRGRVLKKVFCVNGYIRCTPQT